MELPKNLKLIIFDFDGTLFHLDELPWAELRTRLAKDNENLGEAIQRLRSANDPSLDIVTAAELKAVGEKRLEAAVVEALVKLSARYKLAILSRNARQAIEWAIRGTKLAGNIYIAGRQEVQHLKPHPEGVGTILRHFNLAPEQAIMVGDTHQDIQAAKNAGVTSIIVRNKRLSYRPEGADQYIETLAELANI